MKKMHYSLIMVFGLAFIAASVCAKDFSFINISWDDSPRDVAKKAKDNGYGAILWISSSDLASGTPMRLQVDSLISASVDSKRNWQLRRYNFYPRSGEESEAVGDIPYVKQLKFYGRRGSIVDEGAFYFSYTTDALLGYKITLNHKSMNNAQINEMLMKKYGKPSKKDKHSKIWKINGQVLYSDKTVDKTYLIYLNDGKINNHTSRFELFLKNFRANKKALAKAQSANKF